MEEDVISPLSSVLSQKWLHKQLNFKFEYMPRIKEREWKIYRIFGGFTKLMIKLFQCISLDFGYLDGSGTLHGQDNTLNHKNALILLYMTAHPCTLSY